MKMFEIIDTNKLYTFCRENNLCTYMDCILYNRMKYYAKDNYRLPTYFHDVALIIAMGSLTDMSIDEIERALHTMTILEEFE